VPNRLGPERWERLVPWLLRVAWIAVVFLAVPAIDEAFENRSDAVHDVVSVVGGALWVLGVGAMAVPAVVSLTVTRLIVPLSVPAAFLAAVGGADALAAVAFVAAALIATFVAFTAALGRAFVQASAYGDEDRHLLRPPLAYVTACIVTWALWAAAMIAAPLLLGDRRWLSGGILAAIAAGGTWWGWRRWHRLSRRWFVLVPTGVVVHDHLVLGETLMLRRPEVAALRLAPAGTEALDLTGPAPGHAVEVLTNGATTAILAATPRTPRGSAIHFTACLVAPTRPGRLLTAARARRFPVG
jgi:hypothetical protein